MNNSNKVTLLISLSPSYVVVVVNQIIEILKKWNLFKFPEKNVTKDEDNVTCRLRETNFLTWSFTHSQSVNLFTTSHAVLLLLVFFSFASSFIFVTLCFVSKKFNFIFEGQTKCLSGFSAIIFVTRFNLSYWMLKKDSKISFHLT